MSTEFTTEYHRNYGRPFEAPRVPIRCGSPSSKLAQTAEPCFKQKRKEAGHQSRRTYTTDYVQYEDTQRADENVVTDNDKAMRYRAGYRRAPFYPVSQYQMNYCWNLGKTPLELAAEQHKLPDHDDRAPPPVEQSLNQASRSDSHLLPSKMAAVPSSLSENVPRASKSDHSPCSVMRKKDGRSSPNRRSPPPPADESRTQSTSYHSHGPQIVSRHRSRSPGCRHRKPDDSRRCHDHRRRDHRRRATDIPARDSCPEAKDDRARYLSVASEVVQQSKTGRHERENGLTSHQPRERQRRERKRLTGHNVRDREKENQRQHHERNKPAEAGADPNSATVAPGDEHNFYRRYQRSTAFPSPPRHRSGSHWTTEYRENYGSPLKVSYVNGVWRGAPSPERHLEGSIAQKQSEAEPSIVAPPQVRESPVVLQHSASANWFDQVVELREKVDNYRERTRGNYFSHDKLKRLEQAPQELRQRASSAVLRPSSPSPSSSSASSLSITPVPGDDAFEGSDPDSHTRRSACPGRIAAEQRDDDDVATLRIEDIELSEDPLATSQRERAVHTSGGPFPPADHPAQSPTPPPPVSHLLRGPPIRPRAGNGRLPTPELARQQAADPNATHRHHLDRTTPTKGNLLASIPHSLHLMGGNRKPRLAGRPVAVGNSRSAAPPPSHKSQPTRAKSTARRVILRDDCAEQGVSRQPSSGRSLGTGLSRSLSQQQYAPRSQFRSSHPASNAVATQPRPTIAMETSVAQTRPTATLAHYPPVRPAIANESALPTTRTSALATTSATGTEPLHRSSRPESRTLATDPAYRPVAARPLSCCTGTTCETCGAALRSSCPTQQTHPSRPTDGNGYRASRLGHARGGVSSTPGAVDRGNDTGSYHPPPLREQNCGLSLSSLSLSSNCSIASDILERARHRRDHFWQ